MASIKCPACGHADIESVQISRLEKKFEGITIQIDDANILRCPA